MILAIAPIGLAILMLILAGGSHGAFAIRHWGPLAVFVLVALAFGGTAHSLHGAVLIAVTALWAFAGWSLLSAVWAHSPARALEGGAQNALYAGLFTLPIVALPDARSARYPGIALVVGIGGITVATFAAVLWQGSDLFLAGRLNDPIGYRNGTAALFALAFWPLLCIAAVRRTPVIVRAASFGVATLALGLAFLTQSRGAAIGFVAGGFVAIAIGPDRIRRAWFSLLGVALVAAVAGSLLAPYDGFLDARVATAEQVRTAARALGAIAALGALLTAGVALLDNGVRLSADADRAARRVALGLLISLGLAGAVGMLAAIGNPVQFARDKTAEFRGLETQSVQRTRLASTGGPRADLYRVALAEFRDAPLLGVGKGNYSVGWYELRRSDRNLTDAHSLPLGILAEGGLVGTGLFALFLAAVLLALSRSLSRLPSDERRWASMLAAAGAVVLAQSSVDWLWLIPGLAGTALLCLGLAVAIASPSGRVRQGPAAAVAGRLLLIVPLVVAALVAALFLSDLQTQKARAAPAASPEQQLESARTAERLNPFAPTPRYLQAGALESLGRRQEARRELRGALELEPRSFVTLALMGDLEVRAGDRGAARRLYRRALALNPLDTGLQKLAAG